MKFLLICVHRGRHLIGPRAINATAAAAEQIVANAADKKYEKVMYAWIIGSAASAMFSRRNENMSSARPLQRSICNLNWTSVWLNIIENHALQASVYK